MSYTIVAQATASGISGLSVIRVSGDDALVISDKCFKGKKKIVDATTHTILYGYFIDNGNIIDDVTASVFHAPHSYTGENTIEFGTHGGNIVPTQIIQALIQAGCRHAEPGEFTRRAFINGKINLVQAEAVADIIHSISIPSAIISARQLRGGITNKLNELRNKLIEIASMIELEMDFADENIILTSDNNILDILNYAIKICTELTASYKSSNIMRDGFMLAIIGKPNAGKSTLFNNLLNSQRSIVSNIPGTTRDYISEHIYINDIPIKLIDTAGLRDTNDIIEIEGIEYTQKILEQANLILLVNDFSTNNNYQDLYNEISNKYQFAKIIVIQNKIDLINNFRESKIDTSESTEIIYISAKEHNDLLKNRISEIAKQQLDNTNDILLNERQYFKLLETLQALVTAKNLLLHKTISEIIAIEIRNAGKLLGELTGETWNEKVLNNIFEKFCIGK